MTSRYRTVYSQWQDDPDGFWLEQARAIAWFEPPAIAFDRTAGVYGRWFPEALCNTCFNALDRHVAAGRGNRTALIYDSPVTGTCRSFTYLELLDEVKVFALALRRLGLGKGDRVVISMPMVPQTAIAMLACARVGAVHSVVFGGFAAAELAARIDDARPRLVLSASCGIEPRRIVAYKPLLDRALDLSAHAPEAVVILQRPQCEATMRPGRDHDWEDLCGAARKEIAAGAEAPCEAVLSTDPLYILYTSGTTGRPKGVVRDNGGHMVALNFSLTQIYGVNPGEVFFAASDIGWVVGHSYIVYGPLIAGATGILLEGKPVGTPDAALYWRIVAEHGVVSMFAAPTAIRAIRKEDPDGLLPRRFDLSRFRTLFLSGERADTETILWAERALGKPVLDHWWQTEAGWPIAANPAGLGLMPVKYASTGLQMPGYRIEILDEAAKPVATGVVGAISIRLPLPPGALPTLWNADQRFKDGYLTAYPGYYSTSDAGFIDDDGYLTVLGRTDDVINVAGHRLSTGDMEQAVASHPLVAECAVIGMRDSLKGEIPCGFVVLRDGPTPLAGAVESEIVERVRERIGPVAAFRRVVLVERLPKTRSGKILRATMKKIADGDAWEMPATIEDPGVLSEIDRALWAPAR